MVQAETVTCLLLKHKKGTHNARMCKQVARVPRLIHELQGEKERRRGGGGEGEDVLRGGGGGGEVVEEEEEVPGEGEEEEKAPSLTEQPLAGPLWLCT